MYTKIAILICFLILMADHQKRVLCDIKWVDPREDGFNVEFEEKCLQGDKDTVYASLLKKFVSIMFSKEKYHCDTYSNLNKRTLQISISSDELEMVNNLADPRDLDTILSKVLGSVKDVNTVEKNESIFKLIFKYILNYISASEVRFYLYFVGVVLLAVFIHHRYNVRYIIIFIVGMFMFGFIISYLECNRKLELDTMLEAFDDAEPDVGWFSHLRGYFVSNSEQLKSEQRMKMRKATKINLGFCRPDHVFLSYLNELFFKNVENIAERGMAVLTHVKDYFPFPFNYAAILAQFFLIAHFLKLIFKYVLSPKMWLGFIYSNKCKENQFHNGNHHQLPCTQGSFVSIENVDRLSGENLKTVLNALTSLTHKADQADEMAGKCSAVQEITGELDAPSSNLESTESSPLSKSKLSESSLFSELKSMDTTILNSKKSEVSPLSETKIAQTSPTSELESADPSSLSESQTTESSPLLESQRTEASRLPESELVNTIH